VSGNGEIKIRCHGASLISRPATAGRGAALLRGGRGACIDASPDAAEHSSLPAPPPPCFAWSPSPAIAGADKQFRSRDALASELWSRHATKLFASKKQGRRSADRRKCLEPRHTGRCCHRPMLRARSRAWRSPLAFRRPTAALVAATERFDSARAALPAVRRGVTRAVSRLSDAPRAAVVMPPGSMPGPPGSGVTSPARRNRLRSIGRPSPATSLERAKDCLVS
jgi:hypothetical protein